MDALILRRRGLGLGSCNGIKQYSETGIDWVRNDKIGPQHQTDYVFRWGCTSNIPFKTRVVNEARAIHYVSDKRTSRMEFAKAGLAPKSWGSFDEWDKECFDGDADEFGDEPFDPLVVVRKATHHQGRYLHLCGTANDVDLATSAYGEGNYYISEYIPKVAEYRVFIVQGRVVWVAKKTPANPADVAWNVAKGGRFDNVRWDDWPLRAVRVAREAFLITGLDFGGVDVMVGPDGSCYVLEVNSAPSQTSPYRQQCTAKSFDYIIRNGKDPIPVTEERGGYSKFIHPAISDRAIMV